MPTTIVNASTGTTTTTNMYRTTTTNGPASIAHHIHTPPLSRRGPLRVSGVGTAPWRPSLSTPPPHFHRQQHIDTSKCVYHLPPLREDERSGTFFSFSFTKDFLHLEHHTCTGTTTTANGPVAHHIHIHPSGHPPRHTMATTPSLNVNRSSGVHGWAGMAGNDTEWRQRHRWQETTQNDVVT